MVIAKKEHHVSIIRDIHEGLDKDVQATAMSGHSGRVSIKLLTDSTGILFMKMSTIIIFIFLFKDFFSRKIIYRGLAKNSAKATDS